MENYMLWRKRVAHLKLEMIFFQLLKINSHSKKMSWTTKYLENIVEVVTLASAIDAWLGDRYSLLSKIYEEGHFLLD